MKYLTEVPEHICKQGDTNYVAYCDTDSAYINAQPLLEKRHPNFNKLSDTEKDSLCEEMALEFQDIITEDYDRLAAECFNVKKSHRLEMKTECVIRSAYFRATRRYAQWITKQEGIDKEKLDIKGLEFMKTNFPTVLGEFFNDILQQALKGTPKETLISQIKDYKKKILGGEISLKLLGNPTRVTKIDKYKARKSAGEVFSTIEKGAPAPVKAAIRYNDLLKLWKLDRKHELITSASKIKWVYLKDNPYKIECLAFIDYDMPKKIDEFLANFADLDKVFSSILESKLMNFMDDIGIEMNLNPHVSKFDKFLTDVK